MGNHQAELPAMWGDSGGPWGGQRSGLGAGRSNEPTTLCSLALDVERDCSEGSQATELPAGRSTGRASSWALGMGSTSTFPRPGPKPSDSRSREQRVWLSRSSPGSYSHTRCLQFAPPGKPAHKHPTSTEQPQRRFPAAVAEVYSVRVRRAGSFRKAGEKQTLQVAAVAHPVPDARDGSGTSAHGRGASPSAPCAFC